MPSTVATASRLGSPSLSRSSATSARMPPSPSLSARMISATYFTETITAMDQKTIDTTPSTSLGVGCTRLWSMLNTVCIAYSGLVPMSPKTTPRAPMASASPPRCPTGGSSATGGGAAGAAGPPASASASVSLIRASWHAERALTPRATPPPRLEVARFRAYGRSGVGSFWRELAVLAVLEQVPGWRANQDPDASGAGNSSVHTVGCSSRW